MRRLERQIGSGHEQRTSIRANTDNVYHCGRAGRIYLEFYWRADDEELCRVRHDLFVR